LPCGWSLETSWKAAENAYKELAIPPSLPIASPERGEVSLEGASHNSGDAKTKEPLAVVELFPTVGEEARAFRPAFLILLETRTNSSSFEL
jgi:hypothetical protein